MALFILSSNLFLPVIHLILRDKQKYATLRTYIGGDEFVTFLFACLIALGLGFFCGRIFTISKTVTSRISWGILLCMIFSLGYGVGSNKTILNNLSSLGLQALAICLATIIGSLFTVKVYLKWRENHDT